MKNIYPYIFTSEHTLVNQAYSFDNQSGVTYRAIEGVHAIWAARVPFLPLMRSDDLIRVGNSRIALIQQRQFRFIYDLARIRENQSTFVLRFISTPNPVIGQPNLIDIIFLAKSFSKTPATALQYGEALWERFSSIFPTEDPFGYPLDPVTSEEEFFQYYEPVPFNSLTNENLLEIRKYEDMPIRSTAPTARVERKGDYIAHPFVPSQNSNPMSRFFMAMASQPEKCFVDISLRPTKMFDQEIYNVSFMVGQFKKTASEDDDVTEEYIRKRSQIGVYVYDNLMIEREQLLMVRVHIVGESAVPRGLVESLGSEMMGNAANKYPTSWVAAQPVDNIQLTTEINNIKNLEHDIWGFTIAADPLKRLRYLATAQEAYGAFRLPIPPESGYLPGILVRNEPFISPIDGLEIREQARANQDNIAENSKRILAQKRISIGQIYHRGTATQEEFTIPVRDLTRHALIAGSTGSGKSTTIKHILSQLWIKHKIPFMVLYPIDKPDYRELRGFEDLTNDLLIYTVGDETTSPFRFNPFVVPKGILVKTHVSRLMRVFESAFSLVEPLPMIYREALRMIYRKKGWNVALDRGGTSLESPIMSEFLEAIQEITEKLNYSGETRDNVRQASIIRIGDLLENVGYAINVRESMSFEKIMNRPTIMELGRIGSTDDISLIMGFLLVCFSEAVEINPRPLDSPHITIVEEAHRLMSEGHPGAEGRGNSRGSAGEDFGNMLAEVRAYGEGIIIAEQIPTILVKGAIGNTYLKIMHWLEDAPSFELFSTITNLNRSQQEYARTLKPGFAVVRSMFGQPVHMKIPEFGDQKGFNKQLSRAIDDDSIRTFMVGQNQKLDLGNVEVVDWTNSIIAEGKQDKQKLPANIVRWALNAPMQTCFLCPSREQSECKYKLTVDRQILQKPQIYERFSAIFSQVLMKENVSEVKLSVKELQDGIRSRWASLTEDQVKGWTYCFLAHEATRITSLSSIPNEQKARAKNLLRIISE